MKSLAEIRRILLEQEAYLADTYGLSIAGVFGSYVREEENAGSNVDILIDVDERSRLDLLDLVRLEDHLSAVLGVKADIALRRNLRKRVGQRILREVVSL